MKCAMLNDKERSTGMKNFPSWQLTTTANLPPYHYEPTTLLLRTYDLITTNPRRNKGALKED